MPKETNPECVSGKRYKIYGSGGEAAEISTLGATLVSLWEPDPNGHVDDIVLGYDSDTEYLKNPGNLGASIGRYANRIANGSFVLNGRCVSLTKNRGNHTIHGGVEGFHMRVWNIMGLAQNGIVLSLVSPDGDQGFPGELFVTATFSFPRPHVFTIEYAAHCDQETICSLTNHTYWNLAGHEAGTIDDHILMVDAEYRLESDHELIPTGHVVQLRGTAFDFLTPQRLGSVFSKIGTDPELTRVNGLDHTYLLSGENIFLAGSLLDPNCGRSMEIWTNQPSAQIYTSGNLPEGLRGKKGIAYGPHTGFCFETEQYPDAPNHSNFPAANVLPGVAKHYITEYRFHSK